MTERKLKLAVLTGADSRVTCFTIERLIALSGVQVSAILLDTEHPSYGRRWRNLRRNVRREGLRYLWWRSGAAICELFEGWASRVVPADDVKLLLRKSFPEMAHTLTDFTRLYGIPVFEVGNINSCEASETLTKLQVDLGVVLGTRILRPSTFSVPRLGTINLHKGRVPEYRGQPAGFWEIYEGEKTAGITVHFVDESLDTGDIVNEASIPIHPQDSPETLRRKLDIAGAEVLANSVRQLAEGTAVRRPQQKSKHRPRTAPTRRQRRTVEKMLGIRQVSAIYLIKTVFYLAIYYSGVYRLFHSWHALFGGRTCILLYHRVNDLTRDPLTIGTERFAEHLAMLHRYYRPVSTSQLVEKIKRRERVPELSVALHFDDCYRDIYTNASPILNELRIPACAFVSSGFIDSERTFPHDEQKCPFHLENLKIREIGGLTERGFEIGSHTVNHPDLARISLEEVEFELTQSKQHLEAILGRPVKLFSYPYGRQWNVTPSAVEIARQSGYEAMFSAYGGYVNSRSDPFDIRRMGVSGEHRPLDLLMEIEGLSLGVLRYRFGPAKTPPDSTN